MQSILGEHFHPVYRKRLYPQEFASGNGKFHGQAKVGSSAVALH
jgi:hypothetical protein